MRRGRRGQRGARRGLEPIDLNYMPDRLATAICVAALLAALAALALSVFQARAASMPSPTPFTLC